MIDFADNVTISKHNCVVGSMENHGEGWEEWMRKKEIQMKTRLARVKKGPNSIEKKIITKILTNSLSK